MTKSITKMKFDDDMADAIAGYLAFLMMPLSYSIANGIMFGMLSWILIKLFTGKAKEINPFMYVIGALFVLRIITLVV